MLSKLIQYSKQQQLLLPDTRILVAISGGADSVCLAHLLHKGGWQIELAHCNFRLRGSESDGDEEYVRSFANSLGVTLHTTSFNTEQYANEHGISIEMAARDLRYAWFETLRQQQGLDCVAVAHTQNDVVETFFINLVRGSGIRGLTGIKPRNQNIVRPLLFASRVAVEAYCNTEKLLYRTDSSNLSNDYVRNKFRNSILPQIREINPALDDTIANTINRLQDVEALFNQSIQEISKEIVEKQKNRILISCAALQNCEQANTVLYEILHPYGFISAQIPDILAAVDSQSGKQFYTPQYCLTKDREHYILTPLPSAPTAEQTIAKLGEIECVSHKLILSEEIYTPNLDLHSKPSIAMFDMQLVQFPLQLRCWKAGDSMQPLGMKGKRKKISDLLTDNKVPLSEKATQKVLCSATGDILWLVGIRSSESFKVTSQTKTVLHCEWL